MGQFVREQQRSLAGSRIVAPTPEYNVRTDCVGQRACIRGRTRRVFVCMDSNVRKVETEARFQSGARCWIERRAACQLRKPLRPPAARTSPAIRPNAGSPADTVFGLSPVAEPFSGRPDGRCPICRSIASLPTAGPGSNASCTSPRALRARESFALPWLEPAVGVTIFGANTVGALRRKRMRPISRPSRSSSLAGATTMAPDHLISPSYSPCHAAASIFWQRYEYGCARPVLGGPRFRPYCDEA
jgi:hypothetical protein